MQTAIIVNPASAGGRTAQAWASLQTPMLEAFPGASVQLTQRSGHAADLARAAIADGATQIIAVGGDGTNHDTLQGFFDPATRTALRPDLTFGFVVAGTGGDLGRTIGLPRDPRAGIAWLATRRPVPTDLLALDFVDHRGAKAWRVAANIVTAGIGGLTCHLVNSRPKFGSALPFFLAGLEAVLRSRPWPVTLQAEGVEGDAVVPASAEVRYIVWANAQFNGGGMHIAPDARLDDGLLDALVLGPLGDAAMIAASRGFYDGSVRRHPLATTFRARALAVQAGSGQALHLEADGEACGVAPLAVRVLPQVVQMLRGG